MSKPIADRIQNILTAILIALAVGAGWSILMLSKGEPSTWIAVPAALVILLAIRFLALKSAWIRMLVGSLALAAAFAYASYLNAVWILASSVGMDFITAISTLTPELVSDLACLRMRSGDWWWLLAGALCCCALVLKFGLPRPQSVETM